MARKGFFWSALSLSLIPHAAAQSIGSNWNTTLPSAAELIIRGIDALGGQAAVDAVQGVQYVGENIYRTKSLMEAYSLKRADHNIASTGRQTLSYSYVDGRVKQRVDRFYQLDSIWRFARPLLDPFDFSNVVQDGPEGFSANVRGSFDIYNPAAEPLGYFDGLLTAYNIHESYQLSPLLLTQFSSDSSTSRYESILGGLEYPAVHDASLNLTVIMDPTTYLPYIIRSHEIHGIYGPSTNDVLVYNYTEVEGVQFPRRFKRVYNSASILMDWVVDQVLLNPSYETDFFNGPAGEQPSNSPSVSADYDFSEVYEWSANNLWFGPYGSTAANLTATQPFADLPSTWVIDVGQGYSQMVVELEDKVIVFDAPPHQSTIVLNWAQETLGKPVTHVWPTHHHHDHALGVKDFVDAGATVITLDEARDYYKSVNGSTFEVFATGQPLVFSDASTEVSFVHVEDAIHAYDQSYAVIRPATGALSANSSFVVFQADYWNPPNNMFGFDHLLVNEFLSKLAKDKVAKNALVIPAHGVGPAPLQNLIDTMGFAYPEHTSLDFLSEA